MEQLQQIYSGKINNWQQVGGPDLAITAFAGRSESADTVISADKQILDPQTFASNIQYVYSPTKALRRVNQTPGWQYLLRCGSDNSSSMYGQTSRRGFSSHKISFTLR